MPIGEVFKWIVCYKYLVLYPIMVFEGPIITIIAGFFVSIGHLNGPAVFMVLIVGDVTGDSLYYTIGRWGKGLTLTRLGRLIRGNGEAYWEG